jgi:hypothetical protein
VGGFTGTLTTGVGAGALTGTLTTGVGAGALTGALTTGVGTGALMTTTGVGTGALTTTGCACVVTKNKHGSMNERLRLHMVGFLSIERLILVRNRICCSLASKFYATKNAFVLSEEVGACFWL